MQARFEAKRLTQARSLMMLNMTELAEKVGLTRQAISQFEKGMAPSDEKLREIASALGVNERFFTKPLTHLEENHNGVPSFRSLSSASAKARKQAVSFLEAMAFITDCVSSYVQLPEARIPDFNIKDFINLENEDIEDIAIKTRKHFGLGNGPISNITLLLENHGVVISNIDLHKDLDALCSWFDNRPFIIVSKKTTAVRMRYDLSHELGHLILHKNLLDISDLEDKEIFKLIEQQANYFAGCFLMPEPSFGSEVYGLSFDSMINLKKRWGVSIASMIMRLYNLSIISESKKIRMFQMMNAKNIRRNEPLDKVIVKETPRLFGRIIEVLQDAKVLRACDLNEITALPIKLLSDITAISENELSNSANYGDNVITLKRM